MSLLQFLRILAARKAIIIAALVSSLIAAVVVVQLFAPRYEARSRIILDLIKPDPVTGQLLGNFASAYVQTQMELIKDARTAGQVVDRLGWASSPVLIQQYAEETGGQGNDIRRWLAQRIIQDTEATPLANSNILEIRYTGASPEAAARIADLIREVYVDVALESRRQAASRTAAWYSDQADKASRLLTTAETSRTDFAKANGVVLQPNDVDLESAKLQALSTASAVPPLPSFGAQSSAAGMQLDQINQQLAQAASTLGPNHPVFQALQRQRAVVEAELNRQNSSQPLASAGASAAQIEQAYAAQKSRVIAQRDVIDKLNQMQRDIEIKRDQFMKASQRAADLRLEADVGETGMTPLGDAPIPTSPSFPNVPLIVIGSIGLGLALGVVVALLVEMLGRRVRSDSDLEHAASAPVLAIVGDRRDPDGWVRKAINFINKRALSRRPTEATI